MKRTIVAVFVLSLCVCGGTFLMVSCNGGGGHDLKAFNSSCFPLDLDDTSTGYGDLDFDGQGNLLIANNDTGEVMVVDRETCAVSMLTDISLGSDNLVSVVYDRGRGKVFAGTEEGLIYEVNLSTGANTLAGSLEPGNDVNSMVVAPDGYGSFGGQLILATGNGQVLAYEPVSAAAVTIWDSGQALSDLVVAEDGTLYVVNYTGAAINAVSAAGVVSTFADGFDKPDGIEIDDENGRMFLADSSADILYKLAMPSGAASPVRPVRFGPGWFVSGLAFDGIDTLFVLNGGKGEGAFVDALVYPPFDTSCFPWDVSGTAGGAADFTFDGDRNLIFSHRGTNEVRSIDRLTCTMTTLATVPAPSEMLAIAYHEERNTIYTADVGGEIFAINPSNGNSTLLTDIGASGDIHALAVAPEGYGSYGGHLLAVSHTGDLVAVNIESTASTVITNTGGTPSDLVFANDGTLYVADYSLDEVLTISAGGIVSTLATGFVGPDGLAIDETGRCLFVADSGDDVLYEIDRFYGTVLSTANYDLDTGSFPTGLAFDGFNTLLTGTGETGLTIIAHSP